jgi:hypothetical protein
VNNVGDDAAAVTCWECVIEAQRAYDEPIVRKKFATAQGFPKGWRFMKEFVHADGTVFHRGVEQPKLKGTLEPTTIVVKPKKSKAQKAQEKADAMKRYSELKKQLKKETRKGAIKKIESELKRLQKQII